MSWFFFYLNALSLCGDLFINPSSQSCPPLCTTTEALQSPSPFLFNASSPLPIPSLFLPLLTSFILLLLFFMFFLPSLSYIAAIITIILLSSSSSSSSLSPPSFTYTGQSMNYNLGYYKHCLRGSTPGSIL